MKAHEQAKAYGLKNLKQITEYTGKKPATLRRWHREEFRLFKAVCLGVVAIIDSEVDTNLAPWPDFNGHPLHVGDTIIHPDGERGVIFLSPGSCEDADKWLVHYVGGGNPSRLCLQVGFDGRAVKVE